MPLARLFFPDSPTNAWFLTPEERIAAVQRIQVNQTGVENKMFKKEQSVASIEVLVPSDHCPSRFYETVKDPKTWLLAFFAAAACASFIHFRFHFLI